MPSHHTQISRFSSWFLRGFLTLVVILGVITEGKKLASANPIDVQTPTNQQNMIDQEFLQGKFEPSAHPDFQQVPLSHGDKPDMWIQKKTFEAFKKMANAASNDGISLVIVSAARNFARQKSIWENKWSGKVKLEGNIHAPTAFPDPSDRARAILKFSSMPGTSRHHWGTDIDINSVDPAYFQREKGKKVYQWLSTHAHNYGFCQVYSPKGEHRPSGYEEEPWHWSYTPLSKTYTDLISTMITDADINGFLGSDTAPIIQVVHHYMLGINSKCK